ncbi:MAG: hypothetical protein JSS02_08210 [Planctomycetes bacterium]|nr:hypothetical protein [Planctomycetota bacterium]
MTTLPKLTFAVILLAAATYVIAAPPKVTGNRPIALHPPIPDADAEERRFRTASDDAYVAMLLPDDAEPADDEERARSGAAELKRARELLLKVNSISAKVVEKVDVLEKSFKAEGRYLQLGLREGDWKMRLELAVKIGNSSGSLLEVCDGELLWTRSELETLRKKGDVTKAEAAKKDPANTFITRRNVVKILNAAKKLPDKSYETGLIITLGLGGLPAMLSGIEQGMKFSAAKETTLRDIPVVVVEGTWNDAIAQKLKGNAPPGQAGAGLMPPTAPDSVRVYIDRATGFPHRVMYLKRIQGREVQKPMLTLDFLDVEINQAISGTEFEYTPPKDIAPIELTQGFLDQLAPATSKSPASPGQPAK